MWKTVKPVRIAIVMAFWVSAALMFGFTLGSVIWAGGEFLSIRLMMFLSPYYDLTMSIERSYSYLRVCGINTANGQLRDDLTASIYLAPVCPSHFCRVLSDPRSYSFSRKASSWWPLLDMHGIQDSTGRICRCPRFLRS
jgi:hypothetical protein